MWFDQNGLSAFAQEQRGASDPPCNERTLNGKRKKYPKDVQDSDGYERPNARLRLPPVIGLGWGLWLAVW